MPCRGSNRTPPKKNFDPTYNGVLLYPTRTIGHPPSFGCLVLQCRTLKLNKFCSDSHSSFWSFLTPPLCSEWQNTSKNALWGFSHNFLGVANFFGPNFSAPNPNLGSKASARRPQPIVWAQGVKYLPLFIPCFLFFAQRTTVTLMSAHEIVGGSVTCCLKRGIYSLFISWIQLVRPECVHHTQINETNRLSPISSTRR